MVDIIHRIGIKAPPSRAYQALATAEGVAGWWTRETTGSARVGGTLNTKWAVFLFSLKQLVETGTGRPSPDDWKIDNWN